MSLLSKLKEAVIAEDETPIAVPQPMRPIQSMPIAPVSAGVATVPALEANQGDVASLKAKVHPQAGPLVQFLATLKSLEQYVPEEGARFHAAQETLRNQGVETTAVLNEITASCGRIDGEITQFEAARQRKTATEVTQRETKIADIQTQIADHEAQIKDLSTKRDAEAVDLTTAKAKIAERGERFNGSVRAVRSQYDDLSRKISMYLVGGAK